MAWIGWQVGMSGLPVKAAKGKLKKFSYGKALDGSEYFGTDLELALRTFQGNTNVQRFRAGVQAMLRVDGVLDYATQDALGLLVRVKPVIFTVHGTGMPDPEGPGYPADVARQVMDLYDWQPIGNYPAAPFPMLDSINKGRAELVLQLRRRLTNGRKGVLIGYSQGAIITSLVWKHDILDSAGSLHDLKDQIILSITWGNPSREVAKANGNEFAGWTVPQGRGITEDRIQDTPDWWYDFAHAGDLYTNTPDDLSGKNDTAIWKIIESLNFVGAGALLPRLGEIASEGIPGWQSIGQSILSAGAFFLSNPATLEHINYDTGPAVALLRAKAR